MRSAIWRAHRDSGGRMPDELVEKGIEQERLNAMGESRANFQYSEPVKEKLAYVPVKNFRERISIPEEATENEEMREFRREFEYTNRLNRVENRTGLSISGDEDGKREILDSNLERTFFRASDVKEESLVGVYVGKPGERIKDIQKGFGVNTNSEDKLDGLMYDAKTKRIYLPRGEDRGLANKVGHEIGHSKLDEWMRESGGSGELTYRDAELGEDFNTQVEHPRTQAKIMDDASRHYEEISADILMKERYGDHLSGEVIRDKINFETNGISSLVANSFEREGQYHTLGELASYRARAEIFGLSGITAEIDSELKIQHEIDVNSPNDPIGMKISNLTKAYCELQGLDSEKYKRSFKNIARMSIDLDGGGKWLPPGD